MISGFDLRTCWQIVDKDADALVAIRGAGITRLQRRGDGDLACVGGPSVRGSGLVAGGVSRGLEEPGKRR